MRRRRPRPRRARARVLVPVENLPLARGPRLGKQVRTLVAAGYDVTVVCRRDPGNRAFAGVDLVEYAPPKDAASRAGFVREYGSSWLMAAWAFFRVAVRPGSEALQVRVAAPGGSAGRSTSPRQGVHHARSAGSARLKSYQETAV